MTNYDLEDAIMMLHNIERECGFGGALPNDIRACADRLAKVLHAEVTMDAE